MPRILQTILGHQTYTRIQNTRLLIVGVGGIGCQLLKNLSKSGFKKFTILDLDIIQQTNLNRQFYFRKHHVGKSKAAIGKQAITQIDNTLQVTQICDNIYKSQYDVTFFSKFDIIISALDNIKARQHLAKMSIKTQKPMVDAGTEAYSGQTNSCIRYLYQCKNCRPPQAEQSFAVCTIRNRPEKPIHCIAYAKNFYDCFFGGDRTSTTRGDINLEQFMQQKLSENEIMKICIQVFDTVFCHKVAQKHTDLMSQSNGNESPQIKKLKYEDAILMEDQLLNPPSTFNQNQYDRQKASFYQQQKLWSIKKYAIKFVEALYNILTKQSNELGTLKFQKDDENCMMLVYCLTTLRTYNFMNRIASANKHKFLTYFEVKDMAGKIIAAIASTNSIAAATQIQQVIKIIRKQMKSLKYITYNNSNEQKIDGMELPKPNINCSVCSLRNLYINLNCNFNQWTYGQLQIFLKNYFSYGRDLNAKTKNGGNSTILSSKQHTNLNRKKRLMDIQLVITQKKCIQLQIQPIEKNSQIYINIFVEHKQNMEQIYLKNKRCKQDFIEKMKYYYGSKLQERKKRQRYTLMQFGYN